MAKWIKGQIDENGWESYPRCSNCNYYWKEQVVGPVGEGHSDLDEAKFCPNCGEKMEGITFVS